MKRLTASLMLLLLASPAFADRTDLTTAPPIRGGLPWTTARHEVTPVFGFTLADPYRRNLLAGIDYRYYFTSWLGVGIDFLATYVSLTTGLTDQIETLRTTEGQTGTPTTASIGILTGLGVTLVPVTGKFMLLGRIPAAYDVHFQLGAGLGTTKMHSGSSSGKIPEAREFATLVGAGARVFFSSWIALDVEVRDYMFSMVKAAPANVQQGGGAEFTQNFMATVGVSFYFPPELEPEL